MTPINRYTLKFKNHVLVILARTLSEALEPWARINQRKFTEEEFSSALIPNPEDGNFLLLVGRSITKEELKSFQKEKHYINRVDESPKVMKVEKKIDPVASETKFEDYFEI